MTEKGYRNFVRNGLYIIIGVWLSWVYSCFTILQLRFVHFTVYEFTSSKTCKSIIIKKRMVGVGWGLSNIEKKNSILMIIVETG